jgi:hypothetical protein
MYFEVQSPHGHKYTTGYYLTDGIYQRWVTFVKTISGPTPGKRAWIAQCKETCRKDIKRAFGILQAQFAIVRFTCFTWLTDQMIDVMIACVILHNMISE